VLVALAILLFFAVLGNLILDVFGITIAALRTAGGVLLLLIAIDMVFARRAVAAYRHRHGVRAPFRRHRHHR